MLSNIIFAKPEHFDDIHRIWGANRQTLGLMPKDAFKDAIKKKWILVFLEDGHILGYLQFRYTIKTQTLSIVHLCIDKPYRGKGYPEKLINKLVDEFKYSARGIKLNCRSDYHSAERFWNRYGFQPKSKQPSRGNNPNVHLVTWWYSFGTLDLFSTNQNDKLKSVLDFNVLAKMMECDEDDEAREQILELMADWIVTEVDYYRTSETTNELFRDKNKNRQDQTRDFLRNYSELNIDKSLLKLKEVELESIYKGKTINDISDRRQLAETVLSGIPYFITLDDGILKHREKVFEKFNLKVISPPQLRLEIDYSINSSNYYPNRLSAENFSIGKLKPEERTNLDTLFLSNATGEKKQSFNKIINSIITKGELGEVLIIKERDEIVALVSYYEEEDFIIVPLVRTKYYPLTQTIFMQNLSDLLKIALNRGKKFIVISDIHISPLDKQILLKYDFFEVDNKWIRGIKQGIVSINDLEIELNNFGKAIPYLNELLQEVENSTDNKYYLNMLSLEKMLWPLKIIEAEIPCFIIPIKPYYAKELFDTKAAKAELFGVQPKLIWNKENVYYRNIAPNVEKYPARILWYASDDRLSPRSKAIVCSSYLNEVVTGPAKEIFTKHERFGIYSWKKDILPLAKGKINTPIKLLMFSDSESFEYAIPLKKVKEILSKNQEKDNNFQSPLKIKNTTFMELYALGKRIAYGK